MVVGNMSSTATVTATEAQELHPYDKYQWRKNSSGKWQRDVDEAERFYSSMCRKREDPETAAFPVTGTATFSIDPNGTIDAKKALSAVEESLRKAWKGVRRQCPAIASWIAYDPSTESWKRFCSSFEDALDPSTAEAQWQSDTFRTVETELSEEEWFNTDPPVYKLPTIFFLKPQSVDSSGRSCEATVCFRSPHDVIDGHGVLQILDLLFTLAADIYNGAATEAVSADEAGQLSAPLRVACDLAPTPSDSQMRHFKETFVNNASVATGAPPLGLPTNVTPGVSSGRKRVATALSTTESKQLLAKCKEHGLTVTHAVSAGVVLALRDLQPEGSEPKTLRWYMQGLLSLRYLCQPPYQTPQHAASNTHMIATQGVGLDVKVATKDQPNTDESTDEFLGMAQKMKDYYTVARPPKDLSNRNDLDVAAITWRAVTPQPTAEQPAKTTEEAYAPASVAVSSLGNISSMIKAERSPFTLTNVWVAGEGQGSATPLMLGGWGGRIEVSAIIDSAFYTSGYMKDFQRRILDATVRGLGVSK